MLDKENKGIIDAAELSSVYDVSRHPDVISKRKKPDQVLKKISSILLVFRLT